MPGEASAFESDPQTNLAEVKPPQTRKLTLDEFKTGFEYYWTQKPFDIFINAVAEKSDQVLNFLNSSEEWGYLYVTERVPKFVSELSKIYPSYKQIIETMGTSGITYDQSLTFVNLPEEIQNLSQLDLDEYTGDNTTSFFDDRL